MRNHRELLSACSSKADQIAQILADQPLNGAILVTDRGKILFHEAYGFADIDRGIPNTLTTEFPIASLTKQITAAGIFFLQDERKLNIHDPMSKYIDYPSNEEIKIHHLLTMTSGISKRYNLEACPIDTEGI